MTVANGVNGSKSAPQLSARGQEALAQSGPFIQLAKSLFQDSYSASNPEGFCNLGVAENSLQHVELVEYYNTHFKLTDVDLTYGNDLSGSMRLSNALAKMFNRYFKPVLQVKPEHMIAGAGCSAVIDMLVFHLGDPGDGILIPTPYYTGFNGDFTARSSIKPVPVSVDQADPFGVQTLEAFEDALRNAEEGGTKIRAVMLCNPHNPLGGCYPLETILAYGKFCETHNLHLISDEIYAFSVFPSSDVPEPTPFISALSIDWEKEGVDPARIHVLYGMSKDFNSNGLRGGVLVSQCNPGLLAAVKSTSIFMKMSTAAAALWSAILEDEVYFPKFIRENQRRLREAYEFLTRWFKFHNIPYRPSNAGHFVMADFRQFFCDVDSTTGATLTKVEEDGGKARDADMIKRIIAAKVFVGSAQAFSHPVPGWCRLTFAMRRDYLVVGLARLERVFGLERWDGLDEVVGGGSVRAEKTVLGGGKEPVEEVSAELEKTAL